MSDTQRTVIVTGASRGIGAACAEAFAAHGDRVFGLSRSAGAPGSGVDHRSVDLADGASLTSAIDAIEEETGSLDVLVANAGITRDQLSVRMSDEEFEEVLAVNLTATFKAMRRVLKKMIRQRSGRIIVMSSIGAFMGLPGQANYAASKAGLIGMARAMAREVASRNITINVIAPGLIATDMTAELGQERLELMAAQVPAGRLGTPEEIAATALFLASPGASYITGAVIAVDGGMGMGL
jgi:NAD(P)-dependent dehydrogenase (short-subunit alcohol dehydrogenase family)